MIKLRKIGPFVSLLIDIHVYTLKLWKKKCHFAVDFRFFENPDYYGVFDKNKKNVILPLISGFFIKSRLLWCFWKKIGKKVIK